MREEHEELTPRAAPPPADSALRRIGRGERCQHSYLEANDLGYFLWEYYASEGRNGGPVNNLILDFKLAPVGQDAQAAKERAMAYCADALGRPLISAGFRRATIVPIPSSKSKESAMSDPRLERTLRMVRPPLWDIRELISQERSVASEMKGITPAERASMWKLREESGAPEPTIIVVFDDLLTSGSHFKAAQIILGTRYPRAEIIGLFLARRALARVARPPEPFSSQRRPSKPRVPTSGRLTHEISMDAMVALAHLDTPIPIMSRGGELVRLCRLGAVPPAQGMLTAQALSAQALRGLLGRALRFTAWGPSGERSIDPPTGAVTDILSQPGWPFAELAGIAEVPVLRPNGTILNCQGYDRATGLFYEPSEVVASIRVPDRPTRADIRGAAELLLNECLGDFPFAGDASRANVLAMMLTTLVRPAVECVPLAVIGSPVAGTGKGLLCDVTSWIVTGRDLPKGTLPEEGPELRKRVTSQLLSGQPFAVFDNVNTQIRSHHLASLLTTVYWSDRLLGKSLQLCLKNNVTWAATGNLIDTGGDIGRRSYGIQLDAGIKKPWERKNFRHPDLKSWVLENRARLLGALLTLVQAYVVDEQPFRDVRILGSFERWCRIVGSTLAIAGVPGFLSDCVPDGPTQPAQVAAAARA